ncbi:MAG: ABC transporter ATP-binding protein [Deltaproteobacteria bacterium]|nr:ABC transporter ATP-binding protein [Deltaproteobacteria bacterium]
MIEIQNLTFTYAGADSPAVRDVGATAATGTIFGLLGPSGAGKSTIQNILIKLLPMQQGSVRFDGVELATQGREFFQQVGVSFEHPNLFPKLTGLENMHAFAGLYTGPMRDAASLLDSVGLGASKDKLAGDYSKGMKQRLVFARSLLHDPRFLFLDEPTSGLDPATVEIIIELIRAERDKGKTIILTTHDMRVADALCDVIGLLHDGKLVACDSPRELKLAHGQHAVKLERRENGKLIAETLFPESETDRARLAALCGAADFETMHSQEATLADIFIKLTGQGLAA